MPSFDLIAIEDMLKRSTATASPGFEEKEMLPFSNRITCRAKHQGTVRNFENY